MISLLEPGQKVSARSVWRSISGIVSFASEVAGAAGKLAVIVESSRSSGSPLFAAMCIAKPLIISFSSEPFYTLRTSLLIVKISHWKAVISLSCLYWQRISSAYAILAQHVLDEVSIRNHQRRSSELYHQRWEPVHIQRTVKCHPSVEYKKALSSIGYLSQEEVSMQYSRRSSSPMRTIFYQLLGDFPLVRLFL